MSLFHQGTPAESRALFAATGATMHGALSLRAQRGTDDLVIIPSVDTRSTRLRAFGGEGVMGATHKAA
jgi:hypothetical protein